MDHKTCIAVVFWDDRYAPILGRKEEINMNEKPISYKISKPKKTSSELVDMMKVEKGITFSAISEKDAEEYLAQKNNYLRTASYRKNYGKTDPDEGQYVNLDFQALADLSFIDTELRMILLRITLDIEHTLKVSLLKDMEDNQTENGYDIVKEFLDGHKRVKRKICNQSKKFYTGNLINKYFEIAEGNASSKAKITKIDCPAWVFVELLTFGDFLDFHKYYCDKYDRTALALDDNVVNPIKELRNTCAHNNCLLTDLHKQLNTKASQIISEYVSTNSRISSHQRKKRLRSRPLYDITCLLYGEKIFISPQIRYRHSTYWYDFLQSIECYKESLGENQLLVSSYTFLKKMIDFAYSDVYN